MNKRLLFLFLTILYSLNSGAIVTHLATMPFMAQKADKVFHGYVGEQEVTRDKLGRIITITSIEVVDPLFATKKGEVIKFFQVGGQLNNEVTPIIGGQQFRLYQEVILFTLDNGDYVVSFGAGQGKFDIEKPASGIPATSLAIADFGTVAQIAPGQKHASMPPTETYENAETLKNEIRLMLKARQNN